MRHALVTSPVGVWYKQAGGLLPVPTCCVIQWSPDDEVFVAYHHDVPSVKTHGNSVMGAVDELDVALRLALSVMTEDGAILISEASGRFAG